MVRKALFAAIVTALVLSGCRPAQELKTEWIRGVTISLNDRPTEDDRYTEVLQVRPNTNVFGSFPYVWLYQQAKPTSTSGYANWLRRIGERPVRWDSLQARKDVEQLTLRLKQDGYFYPKLSYTLKQKKRGLHLNYAIQSGPPTLVKQVHYLSMGPHIDPFMEALETSSLLQTEKAQALTMEGLDAERRRIAAYLQNLGFFTFGPEAVHFDVDNLGHPHAAYVTVRLDN